MILNNISIIVNLVDSYRATSDAVAKSLSSVTGRVVSRRSEESSGLSSHSEWKESGWKLV